MTRATGQPFTRDAIIQGRLGYRFNPLHVTDVVTPPSKGEPDLGYKFVVALKDGLPAGVALNAAAHLALGLREAAQAHPDLLEKMAFISYQDADGGPHEPISALSLIVLCGRPSHLRRLRSEADAAGLLHVDFTSTMTGGSYREQLQRTRATAEEDLEYYGLALFGHRDAVDPLTKRLSLWR